MALFCVSFRAIHYADLYEKALPFSLGCEFVEADAPQSEVEARAIADEVMERVCNRNDRAPVNHQVARVEITNMHRLDG